MLKTPVLPLYKNENKSSRYHLIKPYQSITLVSRLIFILVLYIFASYSFKRSQLIQPHQKSNISPFHKDQRPSLPKTGFYPVYKNMNNTVAVQAKVISYEQCKFLRSRVSGICSSFKPHNTKVECFIKYYRY
jgi:hypothetical protein